MCAPEGVATYHMFRESHPLSSPENAERLFASFGKNIGMKEVSNIFIQRGFLPAFASLSYFFPSVVEELQRMTALTPDLHSNLPPLEGMAHGLFNWPFSFSFLCTSPMAAYGLSEVDRSYVHTLFALKERNLNMIQASSAGVASMLMTTAHRHRRHLVQDLRNGHSVDIFFSQIDLRRKHATNMSFERDIEG